MKKSRYTEEPIIGILKQHEAGARGLDFLPGKSAVEGPIVSDRASSIR